MTDRHIYLKVHLKMLKYIYYRILIAQDDEYLRCVNYCWHKLKWNLIPSLYDGGRYTVNDLYPTCNMVGIVFKYIFYCMIQSSIKFK